MASFIKHVINSFKKLPMESGGPVAEKFSQEKKVLNVGGNSKDIPIEIVYKIKGPELPSRLQSITHEVH